MITGNYEKFCKKYELCEGYEKALKSRRKYFLHHIQGEKISREELIENDLYYDCEPSLLRWVTKSEHTKIHNKSRTHSDETKQKMSESHKGKILSEEHRRKLSEVTKGGNHPLFGKKHSAETRKKMSESHKGITHSDETRKKISESLKGENHPFFGKTHSDETRKKMSESSKGGTPWNKGKIQVYSDETRRKMSVAKKGKNRKPFTDETRRKIAAVRKGMTWKTVDGKRIWYKK